MLLLLFVEMVVSDSVVVVAVSSDDGDGGGVVSCGSSIMSAVSEVRRWILWEVEWTTSIPVSSTTKTTSSGCEIWLDDAFTSVMDDDAFTSVMDDDDDDDDIIL